MKSNIDFDLSDVSSFLSDVEPLKEIVTNCEKIKLVHNISSNLPKLMLTNQIRPAIDRLSDESLLINFNKLNERELRLLNVQFSFIGHAYIYGGSSPLSKLPAFTPILIAQLFSFAALTTSLTLSTLPILPGLILRHAAPASADSKALL